MTTQIIQVHNLVKRYKNADSNAVDGVSFGVAQGEFFALLGPNGAGKTTTISIFTTTLAATSGSVWISGHDLGKEAAAVRSSLGIIFQKPSLDLNLTAEENIRFHAILYGLYPFRPAYRLMPRAYREQVEELSAVLGIGGDLFRPVKTYSGGMKRKLEIVRSLIHSPKVLFLDEPTTGLDPQSRRALWEYLRKVRGESDTTIFLTTHYLEEAEEADTICIINGGKIISTGTPEELKTELLEEYLILDAEDRDALERELSERGIPYTVASPLRVDLNGRSAQSVVQSIVTPLSVMRLHTPTLEDAYLSIVGGDDEGI
ncbi:MAG: ATP-binding cassette domain-containing protein [Rubrobacter sp.]|nr:ATP-binding cassette domain-containing protein [Rubrobacter sp.]